MHKARRLYALLGVLFAVCAAAFAVSRYEEKKEQIKITGDVILEIPADSVTALSWTNESGSYSFTRTDGFWTYDADAAFPVDEEKINALLAPFSSFSAAFTIENAEDSVYGLDEPVCTITVTAGEESYTVRLGDISKMDELRYVSLGDGNAYLASHDPLEEFDAALRDTVRNDTVPDFDTAETIVFAGSENYTIIRDAERGSICASDVYFAGDLPLDTTKVEAFLTAVRSVSLTNYVSYNVTDEELALFGLDEPELSVELAYTAEEDGSAGTLVLQLARNPEDAEAYDSAVENGDEELPGVSCYVRLGGSPLVYEITQSAYESLTGVSQDKLRHQKLFTADFDTATSVDVTLGGETYTFVRTASDETDGEDGWTFGEEEIDISGLRSALRAVAASSFTTDEPDGAEEISLTVHFDSETFPSFTLTLYRHDGTDCLAAVDGTPAAFVSRSKTVDLIEAVNKLTL